MFRVMTLALFGLLPAAPVGALIGGNGLIFAAASLKGPLDKAVAQLVKEGRCIAPGRTIRVSYASSGILARQIQFGAPADLFISADRKWIDYLVKRGKVHRRPAYNRVMLTNRLVVVGKDRSTVGAVEPGSELTAKLGRSRLAIGDPSHVPAGRYARKALQKLGLWQQARRNLVLATNVRVALAYVARREAVFGIVYETDAKAEAGVHIVGRIPTTAHPPIRYVGALTRSGDIKCAHLWLEILMSPPYRKIFTEAGYGFPEKR